MSIIAYLSLGSNLGDRDASLRDALLRLQAYGAILAVSSIYETEPVEFTQQPWFLNCTAAIETALTPQELMAALLRIELEMGRERRIKKGPRSIDLDILLFGDAMIESANLTIPHPAFHQRRFVLEPLAEIAPETLHPVFNKTVRQLLGELPEGQAVRRCGPPPLAK